MYNNRPLYRVEKLIIMRTLRNIRKRLKTVTQKQNMFLDSTTNLYNYDETLFTGIKRYAH